jgi:hypothetical protein
MILPKSNRGHTIVTVLENYAKAFCSTGQDVDDACVEEGQPILYFAQFTNVALYPLNERTSPLVSPPSSTKTGAPCLAL